MASGRDIIGTTGQDTSGYIHELMCLGYNVVHDEVEIITDDNDESRKFGSLLADRLRRYHGITATVSDKERPSAALAPYRTVMARHQMHQAVHLPALTIHLSEGKNSIQISAYDRSSEIFVGYRDIDPRQWATFVNHQESSQNCMKKGLMSFMSCNTPLPPDYTDPLEQASKYIDGIFRQAASEGRGDFTCNPIWEYELKRNLVYRFGAVSGDEKSRRQLEDEWKRLFSGFSKIGLISIASDSWWDEGVISDDEVFLNLDTVRRNGYAPYLIDGDIVRIRLYPRRKDDPIVEASVPIQISEASIEEAPIIDLDKLGLGSFSHIIRPAVHQPVSREGPDGAYGVIASHKNPVLYDVRRAEIAEAARQLASAEESWGFSAGELARIIYLVPCRGDNSLVRYSSPYAVLFCDGMLPRIYGDRACVPHEFIHMMSSSKGVINGGWVKELLGWLVGAPDGMKFLEYISERNFSGTIGGHPEDDAEEFLASLLNSLDHAGWQEVVGRADEKMSKYYLMSLIASYHDLTLALGRKHKAVSRVGSAMFFLSNKLGLGIKKADTPWSQSEQERTLTALDKQL